MTAIIRKATLADLPVLDIFLQELIKIERPMDASLEQEKHITYYNVADIITTKNSELYVAVTENDEIIGSGYGQIRQNKPHFAHKEHGYVGFMFVKDKYRGKDISKQILNAIFDWFRLHGIKETRLSVYEENPSAIRAYEKLGFKKNMINMLHYLD